MPNSELQTWPLQRASLHLNTKRFVYRVSSQTFRTKASTSRISLVWVPPAVAVWDTAVISSQRLKAAIAVLLVTKLLHCKEAGVVAYS